MAKKPLIQLYYKTKVDGTIKKLDAAKHPSIIRFISERVDKIADMHRAWNEDRTHNTIPSLHVTSEDWGKVMVALGLQYRPVPQIYVYAGSSTFYVALLQSRSAAVKTNDVSPVPTETSDSQK